MQPTYITLTLLQDLGIALPDHDSQSLIEHLNATVEERIGLEIAESLDDDELSEMVKLQETATDKELADWIVAHVANYKQIVQDNIDIAIGELANGVDDINASA